jgi:predicted kinase
MTLPFHILHCEAPLSTLQQRIHARLAEGRDASEADEAVLATQLQGADPLTAAEQACTITLI